uniref:Uncharacterized protein n=1 Tax=Kwoniella bestiolae CBS 10118 TaxID=1296100 RepID=A0A1B9FW59_9TREE|nr:hypothetical protein I302_07357 [Kwoniella bestiolae CBS 10118]OCF23007.1 hypothetical protein I302_07357 [Kwoniella bestiolae CBS 10118]
MTRDYELCHCTFTASLSQADSGELSSRDDGDDESAVDSLRNQLDTTFGLTKGPAITRTNSWTYVLPKDQRTYVSIPKDTASSKYSRMSRNEVLIDLTIIRRFLRKARSGGGKAESWNLEARPMQSRLKTIKRSSLTGCTVPASKMARNDVLT